MPAWRVRDFHRDDLDQAVAVWEHGRPLGSPAAVFGIAEAVSTVRAGHPGVVAVSGDEIIGVAIARADGERAWIQLFALAARWRNRGVGSSLLTGIEGRLRGLGVRRISALLPGDAVGALAMRNSGYQVRTDLAYYEKVEHAAGDAGLLAALGGRMLPPGLWDLLAGMETEKDAIERRIVLPLAHPELAERYGVVPPKAAILFGPPGTGKTSFAKAIASRLQWPFVELFPARLAADSEGLAAALRATFAELADLDEVLVFIDEVEEIAGVRSGRATDPSHAVTNELLKTIPGFRERGDRLLICATNSVRALDPAFLRPGRFDYVLPVGPPNRTARAAIWRRYLAAAAEHVDLDRLVDATELFTPADIEFAARKGAQAAFEREVRERRGEPATTEDYLAAIAETRPTLTPEIAAAFAEDIETHSRQ